MLSKFQLDNKLTKIYRLYCNGDYGFDHYASKSGKFQLSLVRLTSNLLRNQSQLLGGDGNQVINIDQYVTNDALFIQFLTNQTIGYLC